MLNNHYPKTSRLCTPRTKKIMIKGRSYNCDIHFCIYLLVTFFSFATLSVTQLQFFSRIIKIKYIFQDYYVCILFFVQQVLKQSIFKILLEIFFATFHGSTIAGKLDITTKSSNICTCSFGSDWSIKWVIFFVAFANRNWNIGENVTLSLTFLIVCLLFQHPLSHYIFRKTKRSDTIFEKKKTRQPVPYTSLNSHKKYQVISFQQFIKIQRWL